MLKPMGHERIEIGVLLFRYILAAVRARLIVAIFCNVDNSGYWTFAIYYALGEQLQSC